MYASQQRAQRLSASLRSTHSGPAGVKRVSHVLNAFRRHCVRHCPRKGLHVELGQCSTPFGVTAFDTVPLTLTLIALLRCSTPFGVTAFDTLDLRAEPLHLLGCSLFGPISFFIVVLNAFRRHCVRHPAHGRKMDQKPKRAQRLSASLRSTPELVHAGQVGYWGAQRLSASLRSTLRPVVQ